MVCPFHLVHCSACDHVCPYHLSSLFSTLSPYVVKCLPLHTLHLLLCEHFLTLCSITQLQFLEQLASLLNWFCQVNTAIFYIKTFFTYWTLLWSLEFCYWCSIYWSSQEILDFSLFNPSFLIYVVPLHIIACLWKTKHHWPILFPHWQNQSNQSGSDAGSDVVRCGIYAGSDVVSICVVLVRVFHKQ